MTSAILACDCTSAGFISVKSAASKEKPHCEAPFHTRENGAKAQDTKYGKGRRLHNGMKDAKGHRCTVCGRVK